MPLLYKVSVKPPHLECKKKRKGRKRKLLVLAVVKLLSANMRHVLRLNRLRWTREEKLKTKRPSGNRTSVQVCQCRRKSTGKFRLMSEKCHCIQYILYRQLTRRWVLCVLCLWSSRPSQRWTILAHLMAYFATKPMELPHCLFALSMWKKVTIFWYDIFTARIF